jgi:hypothetical protein
MITMNIKQLTYAALKSSSPIEEYLKVVPRQGHKHVLELTDLLNEAKEKKNDSMLEVVLLLCSRDGLDSRYVEPLCILLNEDWHYSQEDIAMMLGEIKNESGVEPLFKAALAIPDYDDGRSLAKKCILSLGEIKSAYAIEKLKMLTFSEDMIIAEFAEMQINHILSSPK